MLPQLCLLAFVASNAGAATTLKKLCEDMVCGNSTLPLDQFMGTGNIYYLDNQTCFTNTIKVSEEDGVKTVTYEIPADVNSVYTVDMTKDMCLIPSPTNAQNEITEINLSLTKYGVCDKVFFNVECYDSYQATFLVSMKDAPKDCIQKGLEVATTEFGAPGSPDLENKSCK